DFLSLTVEYQEKLYSAGRLPRSYLKRKDRLTEKETLSSRVIHRRLQPLIPATYAYETHVIARLISSDPTIESDDHRITATSTALTISNNPFNGPIAGVRVGRVNGQLIANPTAAQRQDSDLDLILAASKDAIVMVEGGAEEISEADMVAALEFGK